MNGSAAEAVGDRTDEAAERLGATAIGYTLKTTSLGATRAFER